jgi:hypothetical protein
LNGGGTSVLSPGLSAATLSVKHARNGLGSFLSSLGSGEIVKERRKSSRIQTTLPVTFAAYEIDEIVTGVLSNLSSRGVAVQCETPCATEIKPELEIALYIRIPEDATPVTIDLARVRWASREQFGVEFVILKSGEDARLKGVIRTLARKS